MTVLNALQITVHKVFINLFQVLQVLQIQSETGYLRV